MSLAPEAVQERDLDRKHPEAAITESALAHPSRPLAGILSAFGSDGTNGENSRLASSPVMRHPANGELRILALRRAQQGMGNHKTQQLVAQLRHSSVIQRQCSCGGTCESCQEKVVEETEETKVVQRQSAAAAANDETASSDVIPSDSPGHPLDRPTREFMEPRFGADFSDVRVHTDSRAAESADALSADAYTSGRDIYFAAGKYAPASQEGQHLLAHELTHTVQQADGGPSTAKPSRHPAGALVVGDPHDPLETEADKTAGDIVSSGGGATPISQDLARVPRRQSSGFWDTKLGKFVSGVGKRASDIAGGVGQGLKQGWEKTKEAFSTVVEQYAPGVLKFLLNLKTTVVDRISDGLDSFFGGLVGRIRKEGFGSALLSVLNVLSGGMAPVLGKLLLGACAALPSLAEQLGAMIREFGGQAISDLKSSASAVADFFTGLWNDYGAPPTNAVKKILGNAWTDITKKVQEYWAKLAPLRKIAQEAWDWLVKTYTAGKKEANDFLEDLFLKAVEKWQEVKKDLLPYMKYVRVASGILLLIAVLGPLAPVVAAFYLLYRGVKWLWENHGKKLALQLREQFVTSVLPSILSAVEEVRKEVDKFGRWLSDIAQQLSEVGKALLDALGVFSFLRMARAAMADLADKWNKFTAELKTRLAAWTAKVVDVCLAVGRFLKPFLEFLRQTLLVVLFGPLAILDDGVWSTTKKIVAFALTVPCIRELGGLMQVPAMLAQVEKISGVLKAAWALIKNPDPVIQAIHDALAPMVKAVPGVAAALVAANIYPEEPEHQKGVQRHLAPLLQHFMENWWDEIKKIGWTLLWPWDEVGKTFPVFFGNLSGAIDALFDLEINLAIDKGLKSLQALNGVLGAVWGWFALAAVLIGAALGALGVEFTAGASIGAGALAGWGLAQNVGLGLMAVAAATELAIIEKGKFDLQFTNKAAGDKVRTFIANEKSYENIAGSIFSLAMMGALIILGALIHAVVKEVKAAVRGAKAVEPGGPKEKTPGDRLADPDTTAKPGDFSPEDINRSKISLEQKVKDPRNVRPVSDPDLNKTYDAEVDLDDGMKARRNRETGTWCLFRNPRLCGGDYGSDVNRAVDAAIQGKDPLSQSPASRIQQIENRYGKVLETFDAAKWGAFKEKLSKLSAAEAARQLAQLESELLNRALKSIADARNLNQAELEELRRALASNPDKIADLLESKQPLMPDPQETPIRTGEPTSPAEIQKAKFQEAEAAELGKRAKVKNLADLNKLKENPPLKDRPPAGVEPGDPLWNDYVDYWNERTGLLEQELSKNPGVEPKTRPPLEWDAYSEFLGKFRRGIRFQAKVTETLQKENPSLRIEDNVGVAKPGETTKFADQLGVDESKVEAWKKGEGTPEVRTWSNKSRDFRGVPEADVNARVLEDISEALTKYGGEVEIRRPEHPLFGRTAKVTKVTLVYDAKLVPPEIRPSVLKAAEGTGVAVEFR